MIDEVDARLKDWVGTVLGAVNVALTPPLPAQAEPVVYLYLLQVAPTLAAPDNMRSPRQVILRYLVTVRTEAPEQAHKLLGDLIFAALDSTEFEVDFDPLPVETWIALGTEPQPAFVLKMPLSRERPAPEVARVRVPMVVRATEITSLQGVVLGPQDLPLMGALVELPGSRLYQRTDAQGRFRFPTLPLDPPVKQVRVTAKGRELEVTVEPSDEPLVIRLFEEEGSP